MTYMKLVTGGVKRHLAAGDHPSAESVTLCGCAVTRSHSWKLIGALEGDECQLCAELAFGGIADRRPAKQNPPNEEQIIATLQQELEAATARANESSHAFLAIMAGVPSGLPHPEDSLRLKDALREQAAAREDAMRANSRLSDFLISGIVPEDIQRIDTEPSVSGSAHAAVTCSGK
jgi:hypothetical protein